MPGIWCTPFGLFDGRGSRADVMKMRQGSDNPTPGSIFSSESSSELSEMVKPVEQMRPRSEGKGVWEGVR